VVAEKEGGMRVSVLNISGGDKKGGLSHRAENFPPVFVGTRQVRSKRELVDRGGGGLVGVYFAGCVAKVLELGGILQMDRMEAEESDHNQRETGKKGGGNNQKKKQRRGNQERYLPTKRKRTHSDELDHTTG